MKCRYAFRLLLACACFAAGACTPAQKSARETTNAAPIAGGYAPGDDAREFTRAAAFAAREESRRIGTPIRIVEIQRGEKQVVVGTNLRLRLAVQRNGATTETSDVVVFRDLLGRYHLTSWRWAGR